MSVVWRSLGRWYRGKSSNPVPIIGYHKQKSAIWSTLVYLVSFISVDLSLNHGAVTICPQPRWPLHWP